MTNIVIHRIKGKFLETKFQFKKNGTLEIFSQGEIDRDFNYIMEKMDSFLQKYFSEYWMEEAQEGKFFRFTNDKKEFGKIESGIYTNSINHADNRLEPGISVSCDMSYASLDSYKYFYIVSGKVIGFGSDGEPLLDSYTMKKHSTYRSVNSFLKNVSKKSEKIKMDFCEKNNWKEEQLEDLMAETLRHKCKKSYISEDGEICEFTNWGVHKQKIEEF